MIFMFVCLWWCTPPMEPPHPQLSPLIFHFHHQSDGAELLPHLLLDGAGTRLLVQYFNFTMSLSMIKSTKQCLPRSGTRCERTIQLNPSSSTRLSMNFTCSFRSNMFHSITWLVGYISTSSRTPTSLPTAVYGENALLSCQKVPTVPCTTLQTWIRVLLQYETLPCTSVLSTDLLRESHCSKVLIGIGLRRALREWCCPVSFPCKKIGAFLNSRTR